MKAADPRRTPRATSREAALEAGLREAIQYRGIDDRRAAGRALRAIVAYLHSQPHLTADELHRPLYDLLAALDDLDKGRVAPMLKPTQFGNRPPAGASFREAKGWVLFAVEQLVDSGYKVTEACRKVCHVWNDEIPKVTVKPETIRSWHNRSSKLSSDDHELVTLTTLRQDPRIQNIDVLATLRGALRTIGKAVGA